MNKIGLLILGMCCLAQLASSQNTFDVLTVAGHFGFLICYLHKNEAS